MLERVEAALRQADLALGPFLGYPRVTELLTALRPRWWVARGWAFGLLLLIYGGIDYGLVPNGYQWLVPALGVWLSIHVGRRRAALPVTVRMLIAVCDVLISILLLQELV